MQPSDLDDPFPRSVGDPANRPVIRPFVSQLSAPGSRSVKERKLIEAMERRARQEERAHQRRQVLRWGLAGAAVAVTGGGFALYRTLGDAPSASTVASRSNGPTRVSVSGLATPSSTVASTATVAPSPTASPSASASPAAAPDGVGAKAYAMYGKPRSGLPWHSGMWTGGDMTGVHLVAAGTWRGSPMDFATTYPRYDTWAQIRQSDDAVTNFRGFKGKLCYGLTILPRDRKGKWNDIISGDQDSLWRHIAQLLVENGHGNAAIRVGVEVNGYWFPWGVDSSTVGAYQAAHRRIVKVMRAEAPELTFWLDLNCGTILTGANDRLAPLTKLYPGDDVTDGLSMDHYNAYKLGALDDSTWRRAIQPSWAPGLADGVAFARRRGIGFGLSEWGLHGTQGPGDSPFFMQKMWDFFQANRDVLVYENYFNEPDPYISSGLFESKSNPKSAALYRKLWGRRG